MEKNCQSLFEKTRKASLAIPRLSEPQRNAVLLRLARLLTEGAESLLAANAADLAEMDPGSPLRDRLLLNRERLDGIAGDLQKVASLPSPLGKILDERPLPNGLHLRKVRVPFGVIGVVYEARPNVTFDVFSLCFKSGNACLLKGGRDADRSNREAIALIKRALEEEGADPDAVNLLPSTHDAARDLLEAVGYVDLVIPRGGRRLIDFVRDNARIPCIETGAGVVNTYFDAAGDLEKGQRIVTNAKTRRVSVCNALDCLIIHSSRLADLPSLVAEMADRVTLLADVRAYDALDGRYPQGQLLPARDEDFGTEFMDYKMAVKTVDSLDEALAHIRRYGSGHSEAIVTEDSAAARAFHLEVDAACVYVNAPTSFTDGAQFGLGAEIGISTQKLGARGPMGLEEITTYKWLINGDGQTRP